MELLKLRHQEKTDKTVSKLVIYTKEAPQITANLLKRLADIGIILDRILLYTTMFCMIKMSE